MGNMEHDKLLIFLSGIAPDLYSRTGWGGGEKEGDREEFHCNRAVELVNDGTSS